MPFDSHQSEHDQSQAGKANAEAISLPSEFELSDLERSLPDHLQLLAEQLGEDALHLSALYPPRASQQWQAASLQVSALKAAAESTDAERSDTNLSQLWELPIRWMKPAIVAAGLLLAITLTWQSIPKQTIPESIPVISTHAKLKPSSDSTPLDSTGIPTNDKLLTYHPVVDQPSESGRIIGTTQTEQAMVPAGLFITLSGPEQEAMLDLIEDAKLQQPSVSF